MDGRAKKTLTETCMDSLNSSPGVNVFIACFPKSGSTYVCALLAEVTKFPHVPAVQFYGQNEQDLFEPALQRFPVTNSVTQQHVKGTNNNVALMKKYRIKPVILVRNIFDVVLSLYDHFEKEDTFTPVGYVHAEYHSMSFEERLWFLIHVHLPWYFNFLVSWQEAAKELEALWLTYEEFFSHPIAMTRRILEFYRLTASDGEIEAGMATIVQKPTRLNIGVTGRGAALPDRHRQAILDIAECWRIDPSRLRSIGIESRVQSQPGSASDLPQRGRASSPIEVVQRQRVWLDLGCGSVKQSGFIGIDRYRLPGVDIIADLEQPLPFRDDSVDLVYASHSLEHVNDLPRLMKEIYRVSKHGAQVCIVAPYHQQSLNLANPYHKQAFNEHTPRFWTNTPTTLIPAEEFAHPHAAQWGLSESDASKSAIDLRCLKMEFFYFPEYRNLPLDEQRAARRRYLDVCDQIMFHLVVVKTPVNKAEMQELAKKVQYYDPPFITIRRLREQLAETEQRMQEFQRTLVTQEQSLTRLQAALAKSQEGAARHTQTVEDIQQVLAAREAELARLRVELAETQARGVVHERAAEELGEKLAGRDAEVSQVQTLLTEREAEVLRVRTSLATTQAELARLRVELAETQARGVVHERAAEELGEKLTGRDAEVAQVRTLLTEREAEVLQVRTSLATTQQELQQVRQQLTRFERSQQTAAAELDSFRRRRVSRWLARLIPGGDLRDEIDPTFQQLKDDSLLFNPRLRGFRLQPSDNLQHVPFFVYPLELRRTNLSGVLLAVIVDFPLTRGRVGVEIVSPLNTIVAQSLIPFAQIDERVPVCFTFSPLVDSGQGRFWLRVFVREVDAPVRVFEWRKYGLRGLGRLQRRAFCGFIFQEGLATRGSN